MEEKERYELKIYAGCESYSITDTKEKQQITLNNVINLLNKQDKRIKELEQENLILKEQNKLLIDEEEHISKKMQEVGFDNIEDLCNSQKQVSEGTITVDGNLTVNKRLSMSDGIKYNKVYIWDKELCNGAEWNDFLKCVEEKSKENAELKEQLSITEKALELACKELIDNACIQCNNCNRYEMCNYVLSLYPTSYFIEEAKEMLENE